MTEHVAPAARLFRWPQGGACESADDIAERLFRDHGLAMLRVALLLVGDRASAEDVVQDAFIGLHRALPRLQEPAKAAGYLRAAVVNGANTPRSSLFRLDPKSRAVTPVPDPGNVNPLTW